MHRTINNVLKSIIDHSTHFHKLNSTMDDDASPKLHIAMLPWLAYGHFMPYLQVSEFLAQKGHRISFISTPKNIKTLHTTSSLVTFVGLPLPAVEGLPAAAESTKGLPSDQVPLLKQAFDLLQPALTRFLESSGVQWIVHDFNAHWLPGLAGRLGIGSGYLSINNASSLSFAGPSSEMISGGRREVEDFTVVPRWVTFPSSVVFRTYEVEGLMAAMDPGVSDFERLGRVVEGSRFVALRTCTEFEPEALSLLGRLYGKPVVPVGFLPNRPAYLGSDWDVLREWLDDKKEKSVVYIAFGTEVTLSQEWAHELAIGIEKSGLPFIWVVKDPNNFPPGFKDRVSGRGLIWTGFAPQVQVLGHPAVGGFMTHSGWSSVIEALGLGLPLVLFPGASSDLGLVARLLDSKGVGLEVARNERDGSFTSESVVESIRRVMVDKEGEPVRAKARLARDVFGNMDLQNKYLEELNKLFENGFGFDPDVTPSGSI